MINKVLGLIFSVIESSMPYRCLEKKYWMKNINCIIFINNSVQRGQNEKNLKTIKPVTQILETRNY